MGWIWLAVGGQFLNAIVAVLDKCVMSSKSGIPRPFVYAFYSCLLSGTWLAVFFVGWIPWLGYIGFPHLENIQLPTLEVFAIAILAAYTFFMALVSMFDALKNDTPSNVMPVIGAVAAISSVGFNYLFLGGILSDSFLLGIVLLAVGTFLVSQAHFTRNLILVSIHSGIFFSLHLVAMKGLFEVTSFDNAFFWSRLAFVLFALSLLLVPTYVKKIHDGTKNTKLSGAILVFSTKVVAGVGAFMLLKATDWGEVSVVQATDGLKFIFILFLSYLLTLWFPVVETERGMQPKEVLRKLMYVIIIGVGFVVLFL